MSKSVREYIEEVLPYLAPEDVRSLAQPGVRKHLPPEAAALFRAIREAIEIMSKGR